MTILKIISLLIIVVSVGLLVRQWRSIHGKGITMATVTGLDPSTDGEGTTYKAVAQSRDESGTEHEYRSAWSSSPPAHKVGDQFPLMYDREHPAQCASLTFGTRFGVFWVMLGVGLFLLWIAAGWQYGTAYVLSHFPPMTVD